MNYMHVCICAYISMHTNTFIKDILELSASATALMATQDNASLTDHRVMFSYQHTGIDVT